MAWHQGRPVVEHLIAAGHLERVRPDRDDDVRADVPECRGLVDAAARLVEVLPPF